MRRKPRRSKEELTDIFRMVHRCQAMKEVRRIGREIVKAHLYPSVGSLLLCDACSGRMFASSLVALNNAYADLAELFEKYPIRVKEETNNADNPEAGESNRVRSIKNSRKWDSVIPDKKKTHTFHSGKRSDCH